MDKEKAINIAIGCVMASGLEIETAREVIDILRELETEDSKLDEIIDYIKFQEDYSMEDVARDIVYETDLIKVGDESIEVDECSIEWGDDYCCTLQEFIDKYTDNLLEKVVNVVKSYKEEDK
jgi:hypothetical protein